LAGFFPDAPGKPGAAVKVSGVASKPCVPSYRARKQAVLRTVPLAAAGVLLLVVKERSGYP